MIATIRRMIFGTQDAHLAEAHDILIRCARRCAYDLKHAVDSIPADALWCRPMSVRLQEKAAYWVDFFQAGNCAKDYRISLHKEIDTLQIEVNRLRLLCEANGIEYRRDDDISL